MTKWRQFRTWARQRPFVGGLLMIVAGPELFFSGQLDLGNIHVQLGIEGLQSTVIPVVLVVLGLLSMLMPQHRIFYGVIGLVIAVYTLVGLNLGGFFIGMLLGTIGGILIVAWMPKTAPASSAVDDTDSAEAVEDKHVLVTEDDEDADYDVAGDDLADAVAGSHKEALPLGASRS